jgi:hypothetical protein
MGVPIGALGLAGIDGMFVVWRGIEFLNHVVPPSPEITRLQSRSSTCLVGTDLCQGSQHADTAGGTNLTQIAP